MAAPRTPLHDDDARSLAALRAKYEDTARAEHYAGTRWVVNRRARRTDRREQEIVAGFLERCAPVGRALDVPAGAGRFHDVLSSGAREVVAADAALAMLRHHPPTARSGASAHALPFTDGAFDLVLCARFLHHLPSAAGRRAVLAEFARVARRWCIASHFDAASLQAWRARLRGRVRGRHAVPVAAFDADAASVGWAVRQRAWIARGVSEQAWVLLEKA